MYSVRQGQYQDVKHMRNAAQREGVDMRSYADCPDWVVAEANDGDVIGCCACIRLLRWEKEDRRRIVALFVAPDHRRRGLARMLLAYALRLWGGCDRLSAFCTQMSVGLFESLGFSQTTPPRQTSMKGVPFTIYYVTR